MGVVVRQKTKGKGQPWWVFVSHNGKRTSRQVGHKQAAEEVASQIEAKLKLGQFEFEEKKQPSIPFFKDYAKTFLENYSAMNHKPSTQDSYQRALDQRLIPVFGDLTLDAITRKHVKDFIADLYKGGLSPATIRIFKAFLSCILSEAVDDEIIATHPALRAGKLIPKSDVNKEINPLSWEEKTLFEKTVKENFPRWYPFFLTALRTGLRLGELTALQPGDLDFNGAFIDVKRNYTKGRITTTKSGKTRRVDMSKELSETLKAYLVERKKETLKKGWNEVPEWLFYYNDGQIIDHSSLRQYVFAKILVKAGLRHIRIHDLRHTYATLRISKGDNIVDVSKQLGHHSVKITLDTYCHWVPGSKKTEVDGLDSQNESIKKSVEVVNG